MSREACVLCGSRWRGDRLYAACSCYKKSDSNRLHKECLANIYANKETEDPPRCPICYEVYRVSVTYRFMFAWHRVWRCRSVAHLAEMAVIVVMIGFGFLTLWLFHNSPEQRHRQRFPAPDDSSLDGPTLLIYALFGLTLCLVPFTLRKVYERWRNANSDVELEIV